MILFTRQNITALLEAARIKTAGISLPFGDIIEQCIALAESLAQRITACSNLFDEKCSEFNNMLTRAKDAQESLSKFSNYTDAAPSRVVQSKDVTPNYNSSSSAFIIGSSSESAGAAAATAQMFESYVRDSSKKGYRIYFAIGDVTLSKSSSCLSLLDSSSDKYAYTKMLIMCRETNTDNIKIFNQQFV